MNKLITARAFFSRAHERTLFMADGPGAVNQSLLARASAEAAERDGEAYLRATRKQVPSGQWVLKGVND